VTCIRYGKSDIRNRFGADEWSDRVQRPDSNWAGQDRRDGVKCISPEYVVKFHSGYVLAEQDFRDVSAICDMYGLPLPSEYARFKKSE
jgi:hypothetical protein